MVNKINIDKAKRENSDLLLIIDVQNGFVNEKTKHIPKLVEQLQYQYKYVIATKFINAENSLYRKLIKWDKLSENSNDIELAFDIRKDAIILNKNIYTCVNDNFIERLKSHHIQEVDICGIDTDICVTKCAVDLFEHGIIPYVLKDYCATHATEDINEVALKILARYIGKGQII